MGRRHSPKLVQGLISSWSHTPLPTLQGGLQVGLAFLNRKGSAACCTAQLLLEAPVELSCRNRHSLPEELTVGLHNLIFAHASASFGFRELHAGHARSQLHAR